MRFPIQMGHPCLDVGHNSTEGRGGGQGKVERSSQHPQGNHILLSREVDVSYGRSVRPVKNVRAYP